ncbi:hypothetical protein D3C73_1413230 [compost metagenome]
MELSFAENYCRRDGQTAHIRQHPRIGILSQIFHGTLGKGEPEHRNDCKQYDVGNHLTAARVQHIFYDHAGQHAHIPHEDESPQQHP